MSHDCPFCEIVRDPSLAHVILATPTLLVFLDRMPLTRGHILCIPRLHYPHLPTFPAHVSAKLGEVLPALTAALTRVLDVPDFNVILNNGERAGQTVEHVHWHLIPRPGDGKWNMFARGLRSGELDDDEAALLAWEIKEELGRGLWKSRAATPDGGNGVYNLKTATETDAPHIAHVHGPNGGDARGVGLSSLKIRL